MGEMIEFAANGENARGYLAVPEAGSSTWGEMLALFEADL